MHYADWLKLIAMGIGSIALFPLMHGLQLVSTWVKVKEARYQNELMRIQLETKVLREQGVKLYGPKVKPEEKVKQDQSFYRRGPLV